MEYFILPLQTSQVETVNSMLECQFTYLLLEASNSSHGHYIRHGMGVSYKEENYRLVTHIQELYDAPCEEFLGEERGYRFKIF